jgi:putative transposase
MCSWFWLTSAAGSSTSASPPTPPRSGLHSNSAPRSPWQRAYIERLIGTLRRECLDHVIVFNEAALYRHVKSFRVYYHESRTHVSLAKDTPEPRSVHPVELGAVVAIPQVGGLHHRYERRTA